MDPGYPVEDFGDHGYPVEGLVNLKYPRGGRSWSAGMFSGRLGGSPRGGKSWWFMDSGYPLSGRS